MDGEIDFGVDMLLCVFVTCFPGAEVVVVVGLLWVDRGFWSGGCGGGIHYHHHHYY